MEYEVAILDDHQLFTKSLEMMVNSFRNFAVTLEAHSGAELQQKINLLGKSPDILLLDVSMPSMNGHEVAAWMTTYYPSVKIAAVTMNDADKSILEMIKAGCCSYMLKNIHPIELEKSLLEIAEKGYYNADATNINFRRLLTAGRQEIQLTDRELAFLKFACSDDTYKRVAANMGVTVRTVDGYRDSIFKKFKVESRTGMVLEAVRKGLVIL